MAAYRETFRSMEITMLVPVNRKLVDLVLTTSLCTETALVSYGTLLGIMLALITLLE